MLERVRLNGTLLFHYELGCPWGVALPQFPDAVFHYLSRGLAIVELRTDECSVWIPAISSSSPGASRMSSAQIAGRSRSRCPISIHGRRISGSSVTEVRKSRIRQ